MKLNTEQTLRLKELRDALANALPADVAESVQFPTANYSCNLACEIGCNITCYGGCKGSCQGGCKGGCGSTCYMICKRYVIVQ